MLLSPPVGSCRRAGVAATRLPLSSPHLTSALLSPQRSSPHRSGPASALAARGGAGLAPPQRRPLAGAGPACRQAPAAAARAALRPTAGERGRGGRGKERGPVTRGGAAARWVRDSPSHGVGPSLAGSGLGRRGGGGRRRLGGVAFGGKKRRGGTKTRCRSGAGARSPPQRLRLPLLSGRATCYRAALIPPPAGPLAASPRSRMNPDAGGPGQQRSHPPARRRARGRRLPGSAERPCPRRSLAARPGSPPAGHVPLPRRRAALRPEQAGPDPVPPFANLRPLTGAGGGKQPPYVPRKTQTNVV